MGSIRTNENIGKLVKLTVSTLQLPASRINIGAAQYNTSALTLTLNTSYGPGYLDVAGGPAAGSLYYVYAVVSSGTVYLIASLNSSLPAGFTQARRLGVFVTDAASALYGLVNRDTAVTSLTKATRQLDFSAAGLITSATSTNWNIGNAKATGYADSAGNWRFGFSLNADRASASAVFNVTFASTAAVTFSAGLHGISVHLREYPSTYRDGSGQAVGGTAYLQIYPVGNVDTVILTGDVPLASEPVWATAANMETPIYR